MPNLLKFPIHSDKFQLEILTKELLVSEKSEFQTIEIYNTFDFGKLLLLDGHIQLSTFDEAAYHEALVHPSAWSINNLKSCLIIGGGDGGTLREVVKHKSLETIHMVEIDQLVIDLCKMHLPSLPGSSFDDPRVKLFIQDAFAFVKNSNQKYDLIIIDATDTYEDEDGNLSEQLFTKEFYRDCAKSLNDDGILVTQCDNPVFCPYSLAAAKPAFSEVFPSVGDYWSIVPSFGGFSAFIWASHGKQINQQFPPHSNSINLKYLNLETYALGMKKPPFPY